MTPYIRLPLETTFNTRDLGGLPTSDGKVVQWQKIYRSDDISFLSRNDIARFQQLGIQTVIDLRSDDELAKTGYQLNGQTGIAVHHLPLVTDLPIADITQELVSDLSLGDFYVQLLETSKPAIKQIFEVIASAEEQAVLFHCSAGKDRTGVIAALLLSLLHVDQGGIIANYEITYAFLKQNSRLMDSSPYRHLMYSKGEYMAHMLNHLTRHYKNAETYLADCGIENNTFTALRQRYLA